MFIPFWFHICENCQKTDLEVNPSSIGDGGSGAFLRNCAQTKPSPILRFHRMVFIFCAHIGKLYDPKNGKLYDPKNGKLYDPKKWKTI